MYDDYLKIGTGIVIAGIFFLLLYGSLYYEYKRKKNKPAADKWEEDLRRELAHTCKGERYLSGCKACVEDNIRIAEMLGAMDPADWQWKTITDTDAMYTDCVIAPDFNSSVYVYRLKPKERDKHVKKERKA